MGRAPKAELSRRLCVAAACSLLLSVGVVQAEPKHGLSQFGELKYPPGFLHFDYVNPDAPKGGTIRMPSSRAYYTLNPFIRQGRAPSALKECGAAFHREVLEPSVPRNTQAQTS